MSTIYFPHNNQLLTTNTLKSRNFGRIIYQGVFGRS